MNELRLARLLILSKADFCSLGADEPRQGSPTEPAKVAEAGFAWATGKSANEIPTPTDKTMNTTFTHWNPMRELEDFQHRILSAFHPGQKRNGNGQDSLASAEWMPLVDIIEDEKG